MSFIKTILENFSAGLHDRKKAFQTSFRFLATAFGLVIGTASLLGLFFPETGRLFSQYGLPGLLYVVLFPFLLLGVLFAHAFLDRELIEKKRIAKTGLYFATIVLMIVGAITVRGFSNVTSLYVVSEAYIYSAEVLDLEYKQVYYGQPECFETDCSEKFSDPLPADPFAKMPRAVFLIPKRFRFGEYYVQLIFGREGYQDTLYTLVRLHSKTDTLRIDARRH